MVGAVSAPSLHDIKGRVLVWRDYRGDVSAVQAERFLTKLIEKDVDDPRSQDPVVYDKGVAYLFIQHNNLYLTAAAKQNCNAARLLFFLHRVVDVFKHYFEELEEESLRDNFVVVQWTRYSNRYCWGLEDEDVIEFACEVDLTFTIKPFERFENYRTISFVQPDGAFDLMDYRLSTQVKPLTWVEAQVERHSRSRVEISVMVRYLKIIEKSGYQVAVPWLKKRMGPVTKQEDMSSTSGP
ncbi:hypothetical protein SAY87_013117 [Trapa incisa]|uniref:MHD domain-containing protein n=1 Tax=Trapa incisa TaxID=236973 RepID=A0AAN7KEL6_9MYRT|nr:hypothetical protein SAY87_013117 [Trapa incisa]